uniref:Putative redox protein n=1 Tax=Candidatus Kentrum sp. LPFa TaxID=2126335 RepID=A0A450WZQ5_9GAMM|nr:MAG: putative redox protein [Candidatus Kentron sp. LPFa]VFK22505.1 MAG: putative redox protein [Candidatus Kentron sp. LPFa]VFK31571.1 MAG: putative redox protein [Candidatus Kentron sp. LPFa]
MKARIKWVEQATFLGESGSGHAVVMDGAPEVGGRDLGVRPMEAILMGLGGCTTFDVVSILRKARQPIDDCVVDIEAERAETPPKIFTHIHIHYRVIGRGISKERVERAIALSTEKYCSATIMLSKAARITHDYEIVEKP